MKNQEEPEEIREEEIVDREEKIVDETQAKAEQGKYIIRRPFRFEGKEIREIDISPLSEIRGKDLDETKKVLRSMGIQEDDSIYFSSSFSFTLLSLKSGIPMELFKEMYSVDYLILQKVIERFLLKVG